jgi:hypothetical protein
MEEVSKEMHGNTVISEKTTARYYLLTTDTEALLVKLPASAGLSPLVGELVDMPSFEQAEILPKLYQHEPDLRNRLRPVMLDAGNYYNSGIIGLAIGIPLFALGIWNLRKVAQRRQDPTQHPVMRTLALFGPAGQVAAEIDADVRFNVPSPSLNQPAVTPTWLLHPSHYGLQVVAVGEIVWAYTHVTQHRVNFVPTGKTYRVMIADRRGRLLSLGSKKGDSSELLGYLSRVTPWSIFGYHADLARSWKANPREIIQAADARRQQFEASQANSPLSEGV